MPAQLATGKLLIDEGKALQAPGRFATVQAEYVIALDLYSQVFDLFAQGIDDLDAAKIGQAANLIIEGNSHIQAATSEIQRLAN
jgi:hypothetical protein